MFGVQIWLDMQQQTGGVRQSVSISVQQSLSLSVRIPFDVLGKSTCPSVSLALRRASACLSLSAYSQDFAFPRHGVRVPVAGVRATCWDAGIPHCTTERESGGGRFSVSIMLTEKTLRAARKSCQRHGIMPRWLDVGARLGRVG